MASTNSNIVQELKESPEKLGILSTVLDAKVLHLGTLDALAICRDFGDDKLHSLMKDQGLQVTGKKTALDRIGSSEIVAAFNGEHLGPRARGKVGPNTIEAFEKLSTIASKHDSTLNRAIGSVLKEKKIIEDFDTEVDFGQGLKRRTDILCHRGGGAFRLEIMWRKKTGRAEIANYVLYKVAAYAKALGIM